MAIENMPLDQLERMAKNGVLVAKKELERRNAGKSAPQPPERVETKKRCTRCENGKPKDERALWTGRRYGGGIVLCAECRFVVGVVTKRRD